MPHPPAPKWAFSDFILDKVVPEKAANNGECAVLEEKIGIRVLEVMKYIYIWQNDSDSAC